MRRNVQALCRVGSYQGTEKRACIILSQATGLFCLMRVSQSNPGKRWNSSIQVSRNLTAVTSDVTFWWTIQTCKRDWKKQKRNYESRTADIVNFARYPSMTVMTLPCTRPSSFHIHWIMIILSVWCLEGGPGEWEAGIWRQIGWYTSRTTGGRKEGRKKERYTGVLRKRTFPRSPDFTVGTMCAVKYARTMSLRKDKRQCRKPKHQIGLVPGQARSDIIEWL